MMVIMFCHKKQMIHQPHRRLQPRMHKHTPKQRRFDSLHTINHRNPRPAKIRENPRQRAIIKYLASKVPRLLRSATESSLPPAT
jgi:hypothetical protein